MGMVYGKEQQVTVTLVNGFKIRHMATVFMNGQTETDMKASGSTAFDMAKEVIVLQMEMSTQVNTIMAKPMDMVSTNG